MRSSAFLLSLASLWLLPGAKQKGLGVGRHLLQRSHHQMEPFTAVPTAIKQKNEPVRRHSQSLPGCFLGRVKGG